MQLNNGLGNSLLGLVMLCGACGSSEGTDSNASSAGGTTSMPNTGDALLSAGGQSATASATTELLAAGGSAGSQTATAVPANGGSSRSVASGGSALVIGTGGAPLTPSSASGGLSSVGGLGSTGATTSIHTTATSGAGTGGKSASAAGGTSAGGALCGPRGGVNSLGGFGDELTAVPTGCTSDKDCTSGICYDGPSAQTWSCRPACDTASVGQQGSCADGQICTYKTGSQKAACLDLCTPFQEPSQCHGGDWCYPAPDVSFTAGVNAAGLCLAAGDRPEGGRCPGGGCGPALFCVTPPLIAFDTFYCELACDPKAAANQPGACGAGKTCVTGGDSRSYCAALCDPFSRSSQCPDGEGCYPFQSNSTSVSPIQGRCVITGKHPLGANCGVGECAAGLKCAQEPPPAQGAQTTCRPICDPTATNACPTDETCIPDRYSGDTLAVGTCQKSCQLWQNEPCAAGCASDEWCAPSNLDPGFGYCETAGAQAAGAECSLTKHCAAGNVCLCQGASNCISNGHCERVCDRSAAGSDPLHCQVDEVCAAAPVLGGWSSYGTCHGGCDYDAHVPCADPTQLCVVGELLPHGKDTCVTAPKSNSCSLDTIAGTPCGATALCTDETLFLTCTHVCRVSAGAIGTSNHPDCPDASDVCSEVSPGLAYGKCN